MASSGGGGGGCVTFELCRCNEDKLALEYRGTNGERNDDAAKPELSSLDDDYSLHILSEFR